MIKGDTGLFLFGCVFFLVGALTVFYSVKSLAKQKKEMRTLERFTGKVVRIIEKKGSEIPGMRAEQWHHIYCFPVVEYTVGLQKKTVQASSCAKENLQIGQDMEILYNREDDCAKILKTDIVLGPAVVTLILGTPFVIFGAIILLLSSR